MPIADDDVEMRAAEHLAMLRTLWEGRPVVVDPELAIQLADGLRGGAPTPELIAFRIALGILEEETGEGAEDFARAADS